MNLHHLLQSEILRSVERPSRYVGNEYNAVHKDPASVRVRLCLAFPDMYDLGLGNVGLLVMYAILNDRDWCWCERAYAPAHDMEAALRRRNLPLFANESKDPLGVFDGIGITLQSELNFTNVLNIIDLAQLPLRSAQRDDTHPLIFAGGPAVFNPEPLAPFVDFFVIGEGEEIILEIAELFRVLKGAPREEKLRAFAALEGVYVPALYPFETLPDGRILPQLGAPRIRKRLVHDLDGAKFPTRYIVPYTQQVHDRVGLEILRGCTQGCRFCQPGMVTRPVRERSLSNIDKLMEEVLANTGYEEVSLLSLSTCDYSRPRQLVHQAARRAQRDRVAVSLPSLRLDSFSVELADAVAGVRRSGLTFAPEAATPRMRAVINKWIPDEDLLAMSLEAYKRGWKHVKCYFVIGLPTERDEDIEAIVDLCERVVAQGKTVNPRAQVNTGISTFVPKPFTPFQWAEQIGVEETERKQAILERAFAKSRNIKFGRHDPWVTRIEGLLTRADRRAADLLEAAWRHGARHDSWDEHLDRRAWTAAIEETGYDEHEALRARALDERLPWDHIDLLIDPAWLKQDWLNATALEHAQDCRAGKCHLCGVIDQERELCKHMLQRQKEGRKEEAAYAPPPLEVLPEPEPVQRLRFRIGRSGEAIWLSHLELNNAWIRALRRAKAPLSYSQGFHAHPKLNFASAPPVGEESEGDWMDIVLTRRVDAAAFLAQLQATLPLGFHAYEASEVALRSPALMSLVEGYRYIFTVADPPADLEARIAQILEAGELRVERKEKAKQKKKRRGNGKTTVNVRPMIESIALRSRDAQSASLEFELRVHEGRGVRTRELLELLGIASHSVRILKRATQLARVSERVGLVSSARA